MNIWGSKYKGMQIVKAVDDDEPSLPAAPYQNGRQGKNLLRLLFHLASTILLVVSGVSFHLRWYRGINQTPIELPLRQYIFTDHPELRPFDHATSDLWHPFGRDHWWSMEWRDPKGNQLTQGIDMLHKLHCLVSLREEFTMMATEKERSVYFFAKTAESLTRRMHVAHCFDFIRQDILCQADATVEPLGPGYTRSDGLGVEHQCRDWEVVLDYAKANKYYPEQLKGIEIK